MKRCFPAITILTLITAVSAFGDSLVTLTAVTENGREIAISEVPVDARTVSIRLNDPVFGLDDPVVDIRGMERLTDCRNVRFIITPQIGSFDFLRVMDGVQSLFLTHCRLPDIDFLEHMQGLQTCVFEMCRGVSGGAMIPESSRIDLSGLQELRELAFIDCGLETLPRFEGIPGELEILDLSYNDLDIDVDDASVLDEYAAIERVVITGNRIRSSLLSSYPNLERVEERER